jgi:hypothetical protein
MATLPKVYASDKVKAIFKAWDVNGDGFIDNNEFGAAMASVGSNVCINNLLKLMEDECGNGTLMTAIGSDKKFSYEEFINWLKLDAEIVVKWSEMVVIWCELAGKDPMDKGIPPEERTVDFTEQMGLETALIKNFGFSKEIAQKTIADFKYYNADFQIDYPNFLKILKSNPQIDYVDDKGTCDIKAVYKACGKP